MGEPAGLTALLKPVVEAMGLELWGVEQRRQGHGQLLRVYIDSESGVTVDDCAAVSEQVSGVLDVEDPISGAYTLEVSSPGLDRLLFNPEQYRQSIGELVRLSLKLPRDGRKRFRGRISTADDEAVTLATEDGDLRVAYTAIERARIEPAL